jgi:hypothetical protein
MPFLFTTPVRYQHPIMKFTWQTLKVQGPGPRSRHCLWYDREIRATILFGGLVWHSDGDADFPPDTWMLGEDTWRRVDCAAAPQPRHRGAATFDKLRGYAVLFGGQSHYNRFLGDTWIHKDGSWQRRRFWRAPSRRCGHAMAYDEATGKVVLFGGISRFDRPLGDTWLFDGAWHRSPSFGPAPRRYSAFAYDPQLKGCVLHGGAKDDVGRITYGDAWLYRDDNWEQLPSTLATSPRDDHVLVYHYGAQQLVMIGGLRADSLLVRDEQRWKPFDALPPRRQCAPVTHDERLGGILLYGGETGHAGAQYNSTMLLKSEGGV